METNANIRAMEINRELNELIEFAACQRPGKSKDRTKAEIAKLQGELRLIGAVRDRSL